MTRFLLSAILWAALAFPAAAQYAPCPGGYCPQPAYGAGQQWQPAQQSADPGAIRSHDQRYGWICRVTGWDGGAWSTGSGALVYEDDQVAYVLTAKHVLRGVSGEIVCHFPTCKRKAAIQQIHETADAALLRIAPTGIKPAQVRQSAPQAGETLYGAGYGGSGELRTFRGRASYHIHGELALVGCTNRSGDSGGPIIDSSGRYVAVQWGCDRRSEVMACRWTPVRNLLARVWDRLFRPVVVINQPSPVPRDAPPPGQPDGGVDQGSPVPSPSPPPEPDPVAVGPPGPQGPPGEPGPPGDAADVDTEQIARDAAEIVLAGIQQVYVRRDELDARLDTMPPITVTIEQPDGTIKTQTVHLGGTLPLKLIPIDVMAPRN